MSILTEKINVTAEHQRLTEDAGRWNQVLEILDQPTPAYEPPTFRKGFCRAPGGTRLPEKSGRGRSTVMSSILIMGATFALLTWKVIR
jgi:hypothetical protein